MSSGLGSSRGLPSTGCKNCRARKIKCDEAKPVCNRCVKTGLDGCAYRDHFELAWRDQTDRASERAQNTWRKRAKKKAAESGTSPATSSGSPSASLGSPSASTGSPSASAGSPVTSLGSPETAPAPAPAPLMTGTVCLEGPVLERFWYDWTISTVPTRDTPQSLLAFLPGLYREVSPGSVLTEAVAALAFANYDARFSSPESKKMAFHHCHNALTLLQKAIHSPVEALTNEIMVSSVLLGMYETMISPITSINGSWAAHAMGVATVLNTRVLQNPNVAIERGLYGLIITQMLTNAVLRGRAPSLSLEVRERLATVVPSPQIYAQYNLIYDIAQLFGQWKGALEACMAGAAGLSGKLQEYCAMAMILDGNLEEWTLALPPEWRYSVTGLEEQSYPAFLWPLLEGSWFPQAAQCYSTLIVEVKWRLHFAMKLVLKHALLHTVNVIESTGESLDPQFSRQVIERQLLDLVDRICESCLASFMTPHPTQPKPTCVAEICSSRGFMLLQTLPAVYLCLIQAPVATVDVSSRLEWVTKMLHFLKTQMGFAKGAHTALAQVGTPVKDSQRPRLALQLWGLHD